MLTRQYRMGRGSRQVPLPISAVIQAANLFGCDIYIRAGVGKINVKDYDELKQGLQPQKEPPVFYFDGADEKEADVKFRKLFGA